jgi:hypothetical protein
MRPGRVFVATLILAAGGLSLHNQTPLAQAANSVAPAGDVIVEPATLISAGFEWRIEGDANRNATVAVTYRQKGESAWRQGLPLLRIGGERTVFEGALDYTAPNMFAGSLFGLIESTENEVQFTLNDPDGVSGSDGKSGLTRSVTLRTRAEPQASTAGRTFHVYPPGHQGAKQEPAFLGLLSAYYIAAIGGDWSRASPPRVRPGDTILVHAGVYKDFDRTNYSHEIQSKYTTCCGTPWDGTYFLTQSGTADSADRHQSRRRWRGRLRRRRQQCPFQRDGRERPLFRGHHVPQYDDGHRGGAEGNCGIRRADGEVLALRGCRCRHPQRLVGHEELLHRGQRLRRPQRS